MKFHVKISPFHYMILISTWQATLRPYSWILLFCYHLGIPREIAPIYFTQKIYLDRNNASHVLDITKDISARMINIVGLYI